MSLTHKDVREILGIIDAAEHLGEIDLSMGGFRLHVVRHGAGEKAALHAALPAVRPPDPQQQPAPATSSVSVATSRADREQALPAGVQVVRAPMLGTFYRAPGPGERPFVEVGQSVKATDTVCMIEVMKLFNSIPAGVDGKVVKICAENASMVEFNEVLIHIRPAS